MDAPRPSVPAASDTPDDALDLDTARTEIDDDDVVGHRFLTPEQAQQRAEQARADREGAGDAGSTGRPG